MPGIPARFAGIVVTSRRYIARGSSSFDPRGKAVTGEVGETIASTSPKAASKSR
jgi:hypothetical protein